MPFNFAVFGTEKIGVKLWMRGNKVLSTADKGVAKNQHPGWCHAKRLARIKPYLKKKKKTELKQNRTCLKNFDNPNLLREGTAKSASHGDRNPLIRPTLTPPLSMIGSFFWPSASRDPKR